MNQSASWTVRGPCCLHLANLMIVGGVCQVPNATSKAVANLVPNIIRTNLACLTLDMEVVASSDCNSNCAPIVWHKGQKTNGCTVTRVSGGNPERGFSRGPTPIFRWRPPISNSLLVPFSSICSLCPVPFKKTRDPVAPIRSPAHHIYVLVLPSPSPMESAASLSPSRALQACLFVWSR